MKHDPVGYYYNSALYHPECLPEGIDPNGEGVGAIFTWEDDAFSICSVCNEPFIEREALPLSHGLVILCDSQAVRDLTKRLENCFSDDNEHDVEQIDDGISQIEGRGFIMLRWNDRINGGFVEELKGWDGVNDVLVFQDYSIGAAA